MGAVKDLWMDGQEKRLSDVQLVMGGLNRLLALFEIDVEGRLTEELQGDSQEVLDFFTRYEFAVAILLSFVASERKRQISDDVIDED